MAQQKRLELAGVLRAYVTDPVDGTRREIDPFSFGWSFDFLINDLGGVETAAEPREDGKVLFSAKMGFLAPEEELVGITVEDRTELLMAQIEEALST